MYDHLRKRFIAGTISLSPDRPDDDFVTVPPTTILIIPHKLISRVVFYLVPYVFEHSEAYTFVSGDTMYNRQN